MTIDSAALEQGSPAWVDARLGKITASRFGDVMTESKTKGELSKPARRYLLDLVAETLTGQSQGIDRPTPAMQWGLDNEPAARELYEERIGCKVERVGFIEHPLSPAIGGSPDGLVGDDGGLEIKCPYNTAIHLGYILGGVVRDGQVFGAVLPKEHIWQVHGHLWITGRPWWDFVSFDPRINDLRLALWRLRVYRDTKMMIRMDKAVFAFRDKLFATLYKLKTGGKKHD